MYMYIHICMYAYIYICIYLIYIYICLYVYTDIAKNSLTWQVIAENTFINYLFDLHIRLQ